MTAHPLTSLVTLLVCLLLVATGVSVSRARARHGIQAPAVTGHEMFERAYRIQMNTLENAAIMLPALWLNAAFVSDRGAAALGAAWLAARVWYALAYWSSPKKRGPAFIVSTALLTLLWAVPLLRVGRLLLNAWGH